MLLLTSCKYTSKSLTEDTGASKLMYIRMSEMRIEISLRSVPIPEIRSVNTPSDNRQIWFTHAEIPKTCSTRTPLSRM